MYINYSEVIRILISLLAALIAVALAYTIFSTLGNVLATAMQAVAVAVFGLGILNPRAGIKTLVLLCCYSDFIKRLMVFFGGLSLFDVSSILIAAPAALLGVLCGVFSRRIIGKKTLVTKTELPLLCGVLVLEAAAIFNAAKGGGEILEIGKLFVATGAYPWLILLVPAIFLNSGEVLAFIRFVILAFLPVAIYGICQSIFGYLPFEYDYMESGLTITVALRDELWTRPFSTLNSVHAFSNIMAIIFVLCVGILASGAQWKRKSRGHTSLILISATYLVALAASLGRSSWGMALFGVVCLYAFRTRVRTIVYYSACACGILFMVLNASDALDKLVGWNEDMVGTGGDLRTMALGVSTFSDRLAGFNNALENKEFWTPFGARLEKNSTESASSYRQSDIFSHDPITAALRDFGYIPVFAIVIGTLFAVFYAHKQILAIRDPKRKALAVAAYSACAAMLLVSIVSGNSVTIFPVNVLFWSFTGGGVVFCIGDDSVSGYGKRIKTNSSVLRALGASRLI